MFFKVFFYCIQWAALTNHFRLLITSGYWKLCRWSGIPWVLVGEVQHTWPERLKARQRRHYQFFFVEVDEPIFFGRFNVRLSIMWLVWKEPKVSEGYWQDWIGYCWMKNTTAMLGNDGCKLHLEQIKRIVISQNVGLTECVANGVIVLQYYQ